MSTSQADSGLCPTRSFRVGESQNWNWPVLMVGSSNLGLSVLGRLSVSFRFWSRCWYFARSVKIWLIFGQIRQIWTRSRQDLARFGGFHVALHRKIKNIAGSGGLQWIPRSSLLENLWISPDFVDFMVKSGGSGFWGGNPPADPKGSGPMGGDPPATFGLIDSGGGRSISGGSGKLSRSPGYVDTPNLNSFKHKIYICFLLYNPYMIYSL